MGALENLESERGSTSGGCPCVSAESGVGSRYNRSNRAGVVDGGVGRIRFLYHNLDGLRDAVNYWLHLSGDGFAHVILVGSSPSDDTSLSDLKAPLGRVSDLHLSRLSSGKAGEDNDRSSVMHCVELWKKLMYC